jgi:hypothetical protein
MGVETLGRKDVGLDLLTDEGLPLGDGRGEQELGVVVAGGSQSRLDDLVRATVVHGAYLLPFLLDNVLDVLLGVLQLSLAEVLEEAGEHAGGVGAAEGRLGHLFLTNSYISGGS